MGRDGCHSFAAHCVHPGPAQTPASWVTVGSWLHLQVPTASIFRVKGSPSLRGIFIFILMASMTFC